MMANEALAKMLNMFNDWESIDDYNKLYHTSSLFKPRVAGSWDKVLLNLKNIGIQMKDLH